MILFMFTFGLRDSTQTSAVFTLKVCISIGYFMFMSISAVHQLVKFRLVFQHCSPSTLYVYFNIYINNII